MSLLLRRQTTIFNALFLGAAGFVIGWVEGFALPGVLVGVALGALIGWLVERAVYGSRRPSYQKHAAKFALRWLLFVMLLELQTIVFVVLPFFGARDTVFPRRTYILATPEQRGMAYEDVTLTTSDGLRLKAWYMPGTNGAAVILLHGLGGNRGTTLDHAAVLHEAGYALLALDMRAHGESDGQRYSWLSKNDALAALDWLRARPEIDRGRIGALGLSAGAHAALWAAAEDDGIRAVWADGTGISNIDDALHPLLPKLEPYWFVIPVQYPYYVMLAWESGAPPMPAFRGLMPLLAPRHMMYVGAGLDLAEGDLANRYAAWSGENGQAWVIRDVGHVGGLWSVPEEYKPRLVAFFQAGLR
jgi:pimeloyl-ACP methyl ester carboxylesterase